MPIKFEAPAPIVSSRVQPAGGNAGGPSMAEMYALEMRNKGANDIANAELGQRDRQFADHLQEQRFQFAAQNAFSPRDQGMAQAAQAQQAQRFQLQADLNQTEMTQAENMRLQRLRQGEDAVKQQLAEGTITRDEAGQMVTQLRTGIQPLELKRAAMQVKHQDMQNQQIRSQIERTARMEQEVAQFHAKALPDRITFVPDPNMVADVMAEMSQDPRFQALPPEQQKARVDETVRKRGGLVGMYEAEPGKFIPLPGRGAAAGAGKPEVAMHESGLTSEQHAKHYQQAHDMAIKEQAWQTDDGVNKKYMNPQTTEWRLDRIKQIMGELVPQKPGQGGPQAPAPKPFDAQKLEDANDVQRADVGQMNRDIQAVSENAAIDPAIKPHLMQNLAEMKGLYGKYGTPEAIKRKAATGDKQAQADWDHWTHALKYVTIHMPKKNPVDHPAMKALDAFKSFFKPAPPPSDDDAGDPGRFQLG